jgi:hypothetical protein
MCSNVEAIRGGFRFDTAARKGERASLLPLAIDASGRESILMKK